MSNTTLVTVENLHTWFATEHGALKAVDDVSFTINKAETYALLGESGCGKSVTALSIMRLLEHTKFARYDGKVMFNGQDLYNLPEHKMRKVRGKKIAMIFQEPMSSLNPVMTIKEQIAEMLEDEENSEKQIIEILDAVGLSSPKRRLKQYPHELSGGMKQRVMIAMAIAGKPELLIADEPTTALDVTTQAQILDLLQSMQQLYQMAMLLITHDLGIVSNIADRVGIMYAGQLLEEASRSDIFRKPCHPYTNRLLDSLPDYSKRETELKILEGEVPSLVDNFTTCRFLSRCPYRQEGCENLIELKPVGDKHKVRCINPVLNKTVLKHKAQDSSRHAAKNIFSIRNLKVHFPITGGLFKREVARVKAVDGISFNLYSGKTLSLVGESGCGKTTIANAMLGLLKPESGSISYLGNDLLKIRNLKRFRSDLQIIFQDPYSSMNPRMMVRDIVAEGALSLKVWDKNSDIDGKIQALLKSVGLSGNILNRYPHEFSGGQRQRIAIARALAVEPKLLICDEPTSALDVSVQAQVLNLLRKLQIERNLSYLFITHNLSVVAWLADEIAVMYLGKIVEFGSANDILHKPRQPYTQDLIRAMPDIHKPVVKDNMIKGELPSAINPPGGCPYHPRCRQALDICKTEYPEIKKTSDRYFYYCHL